MEWVRLYVDNDQTAQPVAVFQSMPLAGQLCRLVALRTTAAQVNLTKADHPGHYGNVLNVAAALKKCSR